jgi:hypothetical protein
MLLYQSEDGRTKLDVRLEGQTVWLSQKQFTELFGKEIHPLAQQRPMGAQYHGQRGRPDEEDQERDMGNLRQGPKVAWVNHISSSHAFFKLAPRADSRASCQWTSVWMIERGVRPGRIEKSFRNQQ